LRVAADAGGADLTVGFTTEGVYRCCAIDAGTTCCAGVAAGLCSTYGGVYGACRAEGMELEAKIICARCCEGLTRAEPLIVGERDPPEVDRLAPGCDFAGTDGMFVCVRCGDGICGIGENRCNCPADCP